MAGKKPLDEQIMDQVPNGPKVVENHKKEVRDWERYDKEKTKPEPKSK